MRIKKFSAILLSAVMAISLCACTAKEEKVEATSVNEAANVEKASFDEEAYLKSITEEVTGNLTKLSKDEAYVAIYSYDDDIAGIAKECGNLTPDYTKASYEVTTDDGAMESILSKIDEKGELDRLSDFSKEFLHGRFANNLSSLINGSSGAHYVAITSILNYSRTYVPGEPIADRIRIVPTDDEKIYYYISFVNTGDGALTVNTSFLFSDGDVEAQFNDVLGITLSKIK